MGWILQSQQWVGDLGAGGMTPRVSLPHTKEKDLWLYLVGRCPYRLNQECLEISQWPRACMPCLRDGRSQMKLFYPDWPMLSSFLEWAISWERGKSLSFSALSPEISTRHRWSPMGERIQELRSHSFFKLWVYPTASWRKHSQVWWKNRGA